MANVLDLYLGLKTDEELISSQEYKLLKDNKIDTALLDGEDPDPNAGEVQLGKIDKAEETTLFDDTIDFVKSMPKDMLLSVTRGTMNGFGFVNSATNAVGINPDSSYEFVKDKIDNQMKSLDELDKDSPFVSKMLAIVGQDAAYIVPTYKKFKSLGLPKQYALPLAFGVGQALAFDKEMSMLVDTDAVKSLKRYANIEEGTGADDMVDNALLAIEGSSIGYLFDKMGPVLKGIKNSNWQQNSMAVGGSAATGEIVDKLNDNTNELNVQDQNLEEKKKILNSDEQTNSSTVNEYGFELNAGIVPVFKSVLKEAAKKIPNKGSGEQILGQLRNTPGLKQQELKWSGLDDFLKEKKKVTKDEIQEYLNANTLDVTEVAFGAKAIKPNKELQKTVDDFERKYFDQANLGADIDGVGRETGRPNYDVYKVQYGNETSSTQMDYQTLRSFLGDNVSAENFRTLPNGKLTLTNLRDITSGMMTEDAKRFKGFQIDPIEIEKYKIERIKRIKNLNTGGAKFEQYTEPGGKDYTELVFQIKKGGMDLGIPVEAKQSRPGFDKAGKVIMEESLPSKAVVPFKNPSHMNVKNEIAHVRFKTRDKGNMKILTVEEMQSDFAIAAKKKLKDYKKVTDFPFKNTWYELTTKRLIRYAADNGFDAVAIPKGSLAAKRYNQEIIKTSDGKVTGPGKGKFELYDKAIPSFMKKYGKKWNAKVYDDVIETSKDFGQVPSPKGMPVTIIQLTDDMKKSVQTDGQALFNIFGIGTAGAAGANTISDNMKNNIISETTKKE